MVKTSARTPYFAFDGAHLQYLVTQWSEIFPQIKPFYAMKCNPHPVMLETLSKLGVNFDCASSGEYNEALKYVTSDRIIFANPIKTDSDLTLADEVGIHRMTFDNEDELVKIYINHPNAELILRLRVNDEGSLCRFGEKFGCDREQALILLREARMLKMRVIGFSFHVGSGCSRPELFYQAIQLCQEISKDANFKPIFLDIGGGFSGINLDLCRSISKEVTKALAEWGREMEIIAEPGRFFAESPFTLHVSIIGKRNDNGTTRIYIDDGVYGSFNNIFFDHAQPRPFITAVETVPTTIYGRTCDSIDKIGTMDLPKYEIGDKLVFPNMGAYTLAAASNFNGFIPAGVIAIGSE